MTKNLKNLIALFTVVFVLSMVSCKSDASKAQAEGEKTVAQSSEHDGHSHDGHSHDGHDHAGHSHSNDPAAGELPAGVENMTTEGGASELGGYSVNAAGDLIDADGNIIAKAGAFTIKDGVYLDAEGNKIGVLKKIGNAIGGAATKSAEAMKKVFSGLFKSKEKVGSTYLMSKIVFDEESHRITDFSKGEVEGLAAALKDMPKAKIQVQVHGDADKGVTAKRAEVIKAMLVTLGVDKGQISSKGMGADDAAKAKAGKVEIQVEQTVE